MCLLRKTGICICVMASFTFVLSCKKENNRDCLKGTGKPVTEVRQLQWIDSLRVYDNVNVFINMDSSLKAEVTCGENLLSLVKTEIINSELIIRNLNSCNWVRSYKKGEIKIVVYVPQILKIVNHGTASITGINTVDQHYILLSVFNSGDIELTLNTVISFSDTHGSGDIILHGESGVNGAWLSGTNWFRCGDLRTGYTFIESHTTGDCFFNATSVAGVAIYSAGNIYYTGFPYEITAKRYGTGAGNLVNNN